MTEDYDEACLSMLIANRGGLPEACDFCGQSFTAARWPVPEEGRAWACSECDARWAKEEQSK
jgi:hypothetical protein